MLKNVLTECVHNLSDDAVKFLYPRLAQRLSGDLLEVLLYVEQVKDIDKFLSSAKNADQFYDYIDLLTQEVEKVFRKRPHLMVEETNDNSESEIEKVVKKKKRTRKLQVQ